jgi:hypothetical protein
MPPPWMTDSPAWKSIGAPAGVSVLARSGLQCSVDGGEPTTLAVTNQVDAAAAMCDGAVDDLEVVDNRRIGGDVRGTNPSSDKPAAPQSSGQMLSDLQDPALRRAATNPEGLGSGLTTVSYTPIAAARRFCPPISH